MLKCFVKHAYATIMFLRAGLSSYYFIVYAKFVLQSLSFFGKKKILLFLSPFLPHVNGQFIRMATEIKFQFSTYRMKAWYTDNVVDSKGDVEFEKTSVFFLEMATEEACKKYRVVPKLSETLKYVFYSNPVIVRYGKTYGLLPALALEIPRRVRKVGKGYEVQFNDDVNKVWTKVKANEEIYLYSQEK